MNKKMGVRPQSQEEWGSDPDQADLSTQSLTLDLVPPFASVRPCGSGFSRDLLQSGSRGWRTTMLRRLLVRVSKLDQSCLAPRAAEECHAGG